MVRILSMQEPLLQYENVSEEFSVISISEKDQTRNFKDLREYNSKVRGKLNSIDLTCCQEY